MVRTLTIAAFTAALSLFSITAHAANFVVQVGGASFTFSPRNLTIQVGDSVTWTNIGGAHNVRADDGSFRCANGCDGSGGNGNVSATAWSFTLTFNSPATIPYYCEAHGAPNGAGMSGVITVQDDGSGPGPDPGPDPGQEGEFTSSFEVAGFSDWDEHSCPGCPKLSGTLTEWQSDFPQGEPYETRALGEHRAVLVGPVGADFDLTLLWWSEGEWLPVASSTTPSNVEEVVFLGERGTYLWEVSSISGAGPYELLIDDSRLLAATDNMLLRSPAAKKKGKFGLESVYDRASRNKDYLIYRLDGGAREMEVSFRIKPLTDLVVKKNKHQILQLRQGSTPIVRLFVRPPEAGSSDVRLAVRVRRSDGTFTPAGFLVLEDSDGFSKVTLNWEAASAAGVADGSVALKLGKETVYTLENIDNSNHRVDKFFFGQVTKGKRVTEGTIYFDLFEASWKL